MSVTMQSECMTENEIDAWISILLGEELVAEMRNAPTLPAPPIEREVFTKT